MNAIRQQPNLTPPVSVKVVSFNELTRRSDSRYRAYFQYKLALDNYQRPYVWDKDKVTQLLDDLAAYTELVDELEKKGKNAPDYYMGSILLHANHNYRHDSGAGCETRLCVIDGQQRLTSLSILHYVLANHLPEYLDFHYRSPISARHIVSAQKLMDLPEKRKKITAEIFDRLRFTTIIVEREDLAFTFFDTQNNRGVPLAATDLLKAFHLRAINTSKTSKTRQDEELQTHCARRWETVQLEGKKQRDDQTGQNDFAPELFHYYLWRARNWCGRQVEAYESSDDMLRTFQTRTVKAEPNQEVTLYPGVSNQFARSLSLLENNEHRLELRSNDFTRQADGLPFSIRQPIQQGVGFFLYAEKYSALLSKIFTTESIDPQIRAFNRFYDQVVSQLSPYLTRLYRLAILMYVDRLGHQKLMHFALWLDHVLGAIRLEKKYVFQQAPLNFLREKQINLLDVIAFAYRHEDVIDFLKSLSDTNEHYKSDDGWAAKIKSGSGVQGRYVAAVATYYGLNELSGKHAKIEDPDEAALKESSHA